MDRTKRNHRLLAVSLLIAIVASGIIWGPDAYYALRYRQHESLTLSPELGRLTFIQYCVPTGTAVAFRRDGREAFSGTAGTPPLLLAFEEGDRTYTVIFPGAKWAQENGGTVSLATDGPAPLEALLDVIEERRKSHPGAAWERLIDEVTAADAARGRK